MNKYHVAVDCFFSGLGFGTVVLYVMPRTIEMGFIEGGLTIIFIHIIAYAIVKAPFINNYLFGREGIDYVAYDYE